jgi:glycosyltransferase involved in cell wall biosynthesis
MKVVQVLYCGLGGHGSVAFSLQATSQAAGAWTNSMLFVGVEPLLPEYGRLCRQADVEFRHVHTRPGIPWKSWFAIVRALSQFRPDAILLHSVKTILPCSLYARLRGIPLIAVEHQNNGLKRPVEWAVSRLAMRLADAVVVLTDGYLEELRARLGRGFQDGKVLVIPNGVDTRVFAPVRAGARPGQPLRIGMASRMTPTKRQDLLIEAAGRLEEIDGRDAWRLSLAGDGERLPHLREQAGALQLGDKVEFTGYLEAEALKQWFATLDFYVHASDGETLSTSLLQALAMGLPIVASDVPGIGSLLASGGGIGIAVEQTPDAFAHALRSLAGQPEFRRELGDRARGMALAMFSQDAMLAHYQSLLERCAR